LLQKILTADCADERRWEELNQLASFEASAFFKLSCTRLVPRIAQFDQRTTRQEFGPLLQYLRSFALSAVMKSPPDSLNELEFAGFNFIVLFTTSGSKTQGFHSGRNEEKVGCTMATNRRTWQSFDEMRKAAEEGDRTAQCYLGICYQTGQGVAQDYPEAVRWFRRAADQNDSAAQCYLGVCYQTGQGVPQEYGQAAKWFREAAEQGDPAAQFNLGVLYETGQGVAQNYAEAVKWYHAAAEQGEPQAQFNLGVFYETGQVVPQNYEEAVKWYKLAAEQEVAPAQCNLGLCYETGRGVEQDVRQAVRWFCRAARAGDKTAQHNLGVYYTTLEAAERASAAGEDPAATAGEAEVNP
jgi:TPR repeat protein